jgi:hypothetical protein
MSPETVCTAILGAADPAAPDPTVPDSVRLPPPELLSDMVMGKRHVTIPDVE